MGHRLLHHSLPMLPTGLQMLLLLWLLLWMPELGLSSPLSPGDVPAVSAHQNMPIQWNRNHNQVPGEITEEDSDTYADFCDHELTRVQMVESNNTIYKQFIKRPHSMYMVFNKTELREAVPKTSLLFRAKLHLFRRKQLKEQLVTLSEKYTNNTWGYVTHRLMAPSNKLDCLWFDVTKIVRRWLNQEDDIEVFRLRSQRFANSKDNVLQMDIIGITPSSHGYFPDDNLLNRPLLILLTIPKEQPDHVDSSRHH